MLEYVAARRGMSSNELEERATLQQIRLTYFLGHKSEYRRMRAQARMIIDDLIRAFDPKT